MKGISIILWTFYLEIDVHFAEYYSFIVLSRFIYLDYFMKFLFHSLLVTPSVPIQTSHGKISRSLRSININCDVLQLM